MASSTHAIAVILARAGSQGLPGKNRAPVAGRPCVAWTIDHARTCSGITRIGVSTDDKEVARLAIDAGIEHWPREPELATATARVDDAARAAVAQADQHAAIPHDAAVVLLYGNVPVRPTDLLARAIELFRDSGCDSVQSYSEVGKHHPMWTARLSGDGTVQPWEGDTLFGGVYRRQELPPAYVPDGGVIVVRRSCLDAAVERPDNPHAFLGRDHRGIATKPGDVIDIDDAIDLAVADAVLRHRQSNG